MPRAVHTVLFLVLGAAAPAQTADAWASLPVPGGVLPGNVSALGKVVTYRDSGQVHVWSAFTRRWASITALAPTTVRVANDLALVVEGTTWTAFSSYTGGIAARQFSAAATLLNPTGQRNDSIWLVADGSDLWSYSCFTGTWSRRTMAAGAQVLGERHVAVLADANGLHGLSAFADGWVSISVPPPHAAVSAGGTTGIILTASTIHGFSAHTRTWSAHPAPASPSLRAANDVAVIAGGSRYVGFSGLRGSFSELAAVPGMQIDLDEEIALVGGSSGPYHAFSSIWSTWTPIPLAHAAPPTVTIAATSVLVSEGDRVHAYSAVTDTVSTVLSAWTTTELTRAAGAVTLQSGAAKLYSALLGQWFDPPAGVLAGSPSVCGVGALLRDPSGFVAFSARTGRFVHLAAGPGALVHVDASTAIMAVSDGNRLAVFDGRRDRFVEATLQSPPQVTVWRTSLVAIDVAGSRAYAYGAFHGRLESTALAQLPNVVAANSESARVELPNEILAFTTVPDLLSLWQYPEFRRVFVRGAAFELQMQGPAVGTAVLFPATALLPAPLPFAGLGELELDPASILPVTLPMVLPAGHGTVRFLVPRMAALVGIEWHFQAVVSSPTVPFYLGQATSTLLL